VGFITNTCDARREPIGRMSGRHNYNATRTHLSLAKDAPEPRNVQLPSQGRVVRVPRVSGLHHDYLRREPDRTNKTNKWKAHPEGGS
jgi:hypothetical protein